jgi:hypothetical protein
MPDEKGLGSKILGVFFENSEDETPPSPGAKGGDDSEKSAADIVAELAQQSGRKPPPGASPQPMTRGPVSPAGGPTVAPANVDFDTVFKGAGIDAGELDRVRKAEELLKGLPEATPHEVKKQIVEASLRAFGFDIGKIAAAANTQVKALETFVKVNEQQTAKAITDAKNKISQLEEQIINLRVDIDKRTGGLAAVASAADVRRAQVQKVLEFFNAPTPPAAPKV